MIDQEILNQIHPNQGSHYRRLTSTTMSATLHSRNYGNTSEDFTLFSTLPSEIRDMIWEEVCRFPNIIKTDKTYDDYVAEHPNQSPGLARSRNIPGKIYYKVPSVLHVCAQSRRVALQRYKLLAGNPLNDQKLYINCHDDIMLHPDWFSVLNLGFRRAKPRYALHPDPVDIFDVDWQYIIVRHLVSADYGYAAMRHYMRASDTYLPRVKRVIMERNIQDTERLETTTALFNSMFSGTTSTVKPTLKVLTREEIDEWVNSIPLVGI
jgi:hypothetical protein